MDHALNYIFKHNYFVMGPWPLEVGTLLWRNSAPEIVMRVSILLWIFTTFDLYLSSASHSTLLLSLQFFMTLGHRGLLSKATHVLGTRLTIFNSQRHNYLKKNRTFLYSKEISVEKTEQVQVGLTHRGFRILGTINN